MKITAIILCFNEAIHLERCISSIKDVVDYVVVVDSFSTDETVDIARANGAYVVSNPWVNYSAQFQFASQHVPEDSEWILRIDADEFIDESLCQSILKLKRLGHVGEKGYYVNRYINFMGEKIKYGGVFPVSVIRLFHKDYSRIESRWMDEHIIVDGEVSKLDGSLVDSNLNSLSWWISKHNSYASREAVDLLLIKYRPSSIVSVATPTFGKQDGFKRFLKERIYCRLPLGYRSLFYFLYRFLFRGGFLDKGKARSYHFFQAFWYRYLVDSKVKEVEDVMADENLSLETAIYKLFKIEVS